MDKLYSGFEKDIKVIEDLQFNNKVHAQNNKNQELHRWVHYKEGFSEKLIEYYLNKWNVQSGTILDPFAGSGTTLLEAQFNNISSVGFEVNPFSHMLIDIKISKWEEKDILEIIHHVDFLKAQDIDNIHQKEYILPELPRIHDIFEEPYLSELLFYREYILNIVNENVRKFMLMGYLSILEYNCNARKFCSGLRYIQRKNKNVYKGLFDKYKMMLEDIQNKKYYAPSKIILDSCLNGNQYIENNTIDAFITSPPYANTFDYTNIYKIELWFGNFIKNREDLGNLRKKMIRSHVSTKPMEDKDMLLSNMCIKEELTEVIKLISKEKLWNNHIPRMIWAYFEDMNVLLGNMSRMLKHNGKGALVVANSVYNGYVVPTDIFISKLASQHGLKTDNITIARYIDYGNSNNQRKELLVNERFVRESIIEFIKE